jgi:26S proteasome regulatory subunit T4
MRNTNTSNRLPETHEGLLELYISRLKEHREMEARLKGVRLEFNSMRNEADKLEENLKAIQNSGQLIGEILKKLEHEKCNKNNNKQ